MAPETTSRRAGSAFEIPEPTLQPSPTRILAIDPGTRHCGMAWLERNGHGWHVNALGDQLPMDCLLTTRSWLEGVFSDPQEATGVLVVEGFQLYPDKLQQQGLSRMGTPEVIGALKWLYLDECWLGWRSGRRPRARVAFVEQGASIKQHGRKYMESRGIEVQGSNPHKRDAEAHGWYRVRKLEET